MNAAPCNCDQALQLAARVAELEAEVHTWRTNRLHGGCLEDLMGEVGRRAEVESERDTARAEAAAMREAIENYLHESHAPGTDLDIQYYELVHVVKEEGAGSALLERLRLAEAVVTAIRSYVWDDIDSALAAYDAAAKAAGGGST